MESLPLVTRDPLWLARLQSMFSALEIEQYLKATIYLRGGYPVNLQLNDISKKRGHFAVCQESIVKAILKVANDLRLNGIHNGHLQLVVQDSPLAVDKKRHILITGYKNKTLTDPISSIETFF